MKTIFRAMVCALVSLSVFINGLAQDSSADKDKQKWDVQNPPYPLKSVHVDTDETTWSSLDVTPDGKYFVFDMLGDIYIVEIGGGKARALTQDLSWDIQPSVSPDGKRIAFSSDRDGLSNIWTMKLDGTDLKQITKEKANIMHSPKWSPNGDYIVANKGIMSSRSIPAGEIWLYHTGASGAGVPIKTRLYGKRDQKNIADPAFSPDGKYVYYTQDVTPGSVFNYNRDPLKSLFAINRYELSNGEEETVISGIGGAIVATPSPDQTKIAFIRRIRSKTALFIKDLENDAEYPIYSDMEHDLQEGFGSEGYYPYFDWTPDSRSIVFWTGGKYHRISLADKTVKTIPVQVSADLKIADSVRFPVDVAPDNFNVKLVRWAQRSPDGKSIMFQALGKIYIKDASTGKISRLTKQEEFDEFYPTYSVDGKWIAYTTWNDQSLGSVRIMSANGENSRVVTSKPGHYVEPSFSTDGNLLAYRKFTGGFLLDPRYSNEPGIYLADLAKKTQTKISRSGSSPQFAGDNKRVYFTTGVPGSDYPETQLVSVDLAGENRQEHLYGADQVQEYKLSGDGKWVAFVSQYKAYVAPFFETGKRVAIGPKMTTLPVKQISSRAGESLTWSADNKSVTWFNGPIFYERDIKDAFDFVEGAPTKLPEPVKNGVDLSFSQATDKPTGYKALVGGTVITMRDARNMQEVIPNGVVIIKDNKIEAVGAAGSMKIPSGAQIIDCKGKSIIPGLVDVHAHGAKGMEEIIPRQNYSMFSNLSFGVTTVHDPSNDTSEIFSASEMQKAGLIIGPRIFSTGTILYGAESVGAKAVITNLEDAEFHLQRMKDSGAISVKSYNQPARAQRQQVLAAARKLGMMVVPEGGGKIHQNITMVIDGHTGLEHSLPISNGYKDLTTLWAATKVGYTPTFVVAYGGLSGEEFWYDRTEVWKNERLLRYVPHEILDSRSIRRQTAPDDQYNHFKVAQYAKKLNDAGIGVHIGAHGQREGLAAHWELWMMQQGGFSPWQAIRSGTIEGAEYLGFDKSIGSIEPNKLADLVVIDGDILKDIRRSEFVSFTVLNGRIFDVATMNELGSKKKRELFYFERDNQSLMPAETKAREEEKARQNHWLD